MSQNTGGNQVNPAISPTLIRFKWMSSDSKSQLGMCLQARQIENSKSNLNPSVVSSRYLEQLHLTDFLWMFLQPLLLALHDPVLSNPPHAAKSCLPGPDRSLWLAAKRDSWDRLP